MEPSKNEIILPMDCWNIIFNILLGDADRYDKPANEIWLAFLRSTSHSVDQVVRTYQKKTHLLFGFRRGKVLDYLSKFNNLALLQYARNTLKYSWGYEVPFNMARNGFVDGLNFAAENGCTGIVNSTQELARIAASNGHYDCVVYLRDKGAKFDMYTSQAAGLSGDLNLIKYIHSHLEPSEWRSMAGAAQKGHIECIKYAHESGEKLSYNICEYAASTNHAECLKFFVEKGGKFDKGTLEEALTNRAIDCALYLIDQKCQTGEYTVRRAAELGNSKLLQRLAEAGAVFDEMALYGAAKSGSYECMKFVLDQGVKYGCYSTVNGGLAHVQLMHEYGCPMDEYTSSSMVEAGKLDSLAYLIRNGCKWNDRVTRCAASHGLLDFMTFAHENGCPWSPDTCKEASRAGHFDCFQYAHEHGAEWDKSTTYAAAETGQLACLKYAHEQGCEWDKRTLRIADFKGHAECVQYMLLHGLSFSAPSESDKLLNN